MNKGTITESYYMGSRRGHSSFCQQTLDEKIFHNSVVSLYIPNNITEVFSTGVSFLYEKNGLHHKITTLTNGS